MLRAHFGRIGAARGAGYGPPPDPPRGERRAGDIDPFTRVRCYRAVFGGYPEGTVTLSLLPLAIRLAGPREALWHALIRASYGCTHFIVGRDRKGLYEKARAGLITGFTGVNDPYEVPETPDVVIDGSTTTPEDAAGMILARLASEGYLRDDARFLSTP